MEKNARFKHNLTLEYAMPGKGVDRFPASQLFLLLVELGVILGGVLGIRLLLSLPLL